MITATMEGNAAAQDFLSHLPLKATLPFIPRGVALQFSAFLAPTHLSSEKFVAVVLYTVHHFPAKDTISLCHEKRATRCHLHIYGHMKIVFHLEIVRTYGFHDATIQRIVRNLSPAFIPFQEINVRYPVFLPHGCLVCQPIVDVQQQVKSQTTEQHSECEAVRHYFHIMTNSFVTVCEQQ